MSRRRRNLRCALLAILAAGLMSVGTARAATLAAGSTAILSGKPSLFEPLPTPVGSSESSGESVSQDGRFVAFESLADGLVDGDDDSVRNIYVKDTLTGSVTLASRADGPAGEPVHDSCEDPAISDTGDQVAFVCSGALDPADTNGTDDVYLRDLGTGGTILVSRAADRGVVGDQRSFAPTLSESGKYVAFTSEARNLDPAAPDGGQHVYRRTIAFGDATALVSRLSDTAGGHEMPGQEPSISDDGKVVAYTHFGVGPSDPADTNAPLSDVYVRDIGTGTTRLTSRADGNTGAIGNGNSYLPVIAGNGSAVAFESKASNFDLALGTDKDTKPDVYRRSLTSAATTLVSTDGSGHKGGQSTAPSIDDSGNVVGFASDATGFDPADPQAGVDAYVRTLDPESIRVVSRADGSSGAAANAGARGVAVSGDGQHIVTTLPNGAIVPDTDPFERTVIERDVSAPAQPRTRTVSRPAGGAPFRNEGGHTTGGAVSADGRFVAILTDATGLGLPQGAESAVVVRDRVTGTITLASRADGRDGAPVTEAISTGLAISADGHRVAFVVRSSNPGRQVWVRDIVADRTWIASRARGAGSPPGDGDSFLPVLDADGSRVAFVSTSKNFDNGDTDVMPDIHLRDLDTDQTWLVSRADDDEGAKGDGLSRAPSINADGTRVAFISAAKNLGDGDTDSSQDAHLRDLRTGSTVLVDVAPDGTKADKPVSSVAIDGAGTRVAFGTDATNLPGSNAARLKVFVRDLAANGLELVSRADGADGAPADKAAGTPQLSQDGRYVAFSTTAANLAGDAPAGIQQVYRRDLTTGRTELVSRRNGPDGAAAGRDAIAVGITDGGSCVLFLTSDAILGVGSDPLQLYMRALRADCAPTAAPAPGDGGGGGPAAPNSAGPSGPALVPPTAEPGGGSARDRVAPELRSARLSRRRFRVSRAATAVAAALGRGTKLTFHSTEAGSLAITFERKLPRRRGRRVAYRKAGTISRRIRAGSGRVALSGRLGKKRMAPGKYRLTLVATDAAGNGSKAVRIRLTIARG